MKVLKVIIRILFEILNGIVLFLFTICYFLSANDIGDDFHSRIWAQPFTWVILGIFIAIFLLKFKAIRKIRKGDLSFKSELGSRFFGLVVKIFITGLWISWCTSEAVFNNAILEGLAFVGGFVCLIFLFYWLYHGKKMREVIESRLDETIENVLEVCSPASSDEKSKLGAILKKSELYDKKYGSFSQVLVGSPARSFVVRVRTTQYERRETDSSYSSNMVQTRKEWKFFFCVIGSFDSIKPGIYYKSDFLSFFDKATAEKYNSALRPFNISNIEITETGFVIGIEPGFDIKILGIKIPSQKNLNQLFLAFAS